MAQHTRILTNLIGYCWHLKGPFAASVFMQMPSGFFKLMCWHERNYSRPYRKQPGMLLDLVRLIVHKRFNVARLTFNPSKGFGALLALGHMYI